MKQTPLQQIPGIGPNMQQHLEALGYSSVESLNGADPEDMFLRDCALNGAPVDRCVLYVYRCAVYYANNKTHDSEKLKWWNWKD